VRHFDFVDYDDPLIVTQNPHVQAMTPANLKWAITSQSIGFWQPLAWLSHMIDCQLFGLHPAGHHLMSLALHIAATLMLFLGFGFADQASLAHAPQSPHCLPSIPCTSNPSLGSPSEKTFCCALFFLSSPRSEPTESMPGEDR